MNQTNLISIRMVDLINLDIQTNMHNTLISKLPFLLFIRE